MHRNQEQPRFQRKIINTANSHCLTLQGLGRIRRLNFKNLCFLCEGHDVVDFNYSILSNFQVLTSAK